MKKRFVFFIASLGKGGAERVVSTLTRKMAEEGHSVEILLYMDSTPFYETDSRVRISSVQRETKTNNILRNILWMRRYFERNADVVISFLAVFNILCILSLAFSKIPLIVADRSDPRQTPVNKLLRILRNFLYRFSDRVVVQTQNNKEYFSKAVQKKCDVIANPVDLGKISPGAAVKAKKENIIVTAGRLIKVKNHPLLIKAFAKIHKEFPEYSLVIYGEGNCRDELEKLISNLNLEKCVFLPGSEKNLYEKECSAELFVLSSDCEGMPNALLEAMCLGLPVVSTDVSGAPDIIENGVNGFLVPKGDLDGLTDSIRRMLEDSSIRRRCSENATELAQRLSVEKIYRQWINACANAEK